VRHPEGVEISFSGSPAQRGRVLRGQYSPQQWDLFAALILAYHPIRAQDRRGLDAPGIVRSINGMQDRPCISARDTGDVCRVVVARSLHGKDYGQIATGWIDGDLRKARHTAARIEVEYRLDCLSRRGRLNLGLLRGGEARSTEQRQQRHGYEAHHLPALPTRVPPSIPVRSECTTTLLKGAPTHMAAVRRSDVTWR